jgi:arylsulfatase A-like enzyme
VPLFVCGPGIEGGRRHTGLVQSHDLAPTFLSCAGVDASPDDGFDGHDLAPLLRGEVAREDDDRTVFCATSLGWPMVRRGRYKLILNRAWKVAALFDMERDPGETVNLTDDAGCADVAAELRALLDAELARALPSPAPAPTVDPAPVEPAAWSWLRLRRR